MDAVIRLFFLRGNNSLNFHVSFSYKRNCVTCIDVKIKYTTLTLILLSWVFFSLFEDEEESFKVIAVTTLPVNVITECKGENKLRLLCFTVVLGFAVVIPMLYIPPSWMSVQSVLNP